MIFIPGKTIHRIFEEQVEKTPDRIAVVGMECGSPEDVHHITYRRLNNMAGQLARRLNNEGVDADSVVAIMVERSIEMIVGVLGILKAGGAYLPIDPEYPQDRIDYILADSNAKIVLRGNLKNVRAGCRFKSSLERALE
ncbi:MAG: AMP-binding protein, partial [bacterium]|nr:AMP-binding protein [bacterium]